MPPSSRRAAVALLGILIVFSASQAADPTYDPPLAKASDEGQKAIKQFRLPPGIEAKLWAAEPMLANPVSFAFDEKGRCFVAETFRLHHGVTDDRGHMNWLEDDLASRSTADRVAIYKKDAGTRFHRDYETARERIRVLEDPPRSGKPDK